MRCEASALVSVSSNASGSPHSSDSVLRYDACAPVIGSLPETHSSGGFSVLDGGSGSSFGFSFVGARRAASVMASLTACSQDVLLRSTPGVRAGSACDRGGAAYAALRLEVFSVLSGLAPARRTLL